MSQRNYEELIKRTAVPRDLSFITHELPEFTKIREISETVEGPHVALNYDTFQGTVEYGTITFDFCNQTENKLEKLRDIQFQLEDPISTFTGRDEELELIKEAFIKSTHKKQYNLVVLCGYGGMGKTELAKKYINKNRHEFENIIWINSEYELTITDNFKRLQNKIKDLGYSCPERENIYEYFNNGKSIFVFDNAENLKSIYQYLPRQRNKSLFLVTSQLEEWDPYESIVLDTFDDESAEKMTKSILEESGVEITEIHLQNLMKKCESIPLVLHIIVDYICKEMNNEKKQIDP